MKKYKGTNHLASLPKWLAAWLVLTAFLLSCSQSYEETKRLTRAQQKRLWREDSAALKVAVLPTLDCLPVLVAKERRLYDTLHLDLRPKLFTAQMDCDTAIQRGRVEGLVTDLVRAERMKQRGTPLRYVSATNAYWQLLTNRTSRIKELKGLDDKMLAMTRYSATDLLGDLAVDSAKLKPERVFRIQINDVFIRLDMLKNNEMNALLLTEPQATEARMGKHTVLLDTRKLDLRLGVVAFSEQALKDTTRQRQLEWFTEAYNRACDSINKYGWTAYADVLQKYCRVQPAVLAKLPKDLKYQHAAPPREKDVERAQQWLKGK